MSDRPRRTQSLYDLDYTILHKTGEKVHKTNMDLNTLRIKERQIRDDLVENLRLYDLQDLETLDDVLEGLENVTEVGKNYRHIHVELQVSMAEADYLAEFAKAGDFTDMVRRYQANAKTKSRHLKQVESEATTMRVRAEQTEEELKSKRASLEVEEEVFRGKLDDEIKNFELGEITGIKHSCKRFEHLLDECYSLLSRAKILFGTDFDDKYKILFDDSITKIRKQIKIGSNKISTLISDERDLSAREKEKESEASNEKRFSELKSHAQILTNEIELRSQALVTQCVSSILQSLNDYDLLDRSKKLVNIDVEMREVISKFSEVSKIIASLGPDEEHLLTKPRRSHDRALKARNTYAQELHALISERDISDEKMKKSKDLQIEVPKFRGYDSKLDIYSFRSEFEKFIQPSVQKQYWVDVLKKNCLSGPALILVDKCENIDDAWEKLTNAYGNVKLLLQNKISQLDKFEKLDKIKGDEKIGHSLAKIINIMTELTSLAQKFNLEYKLYVGGGLEKILSLLGDARERRFVKASLERTTTPSSSGASSAELCAEQSEWEFLKSFLEKERNLRERMTLL